MWRMRQEGDVASQTKENIESEDLTLEFEFPKVQLASNCFWHVQLGMANVCSLA